MKGQQPMNPSQLYKCADDAHNGHFSEDDAGTNNVNDGEMTDLNQRLTSLKLPHIASIAQPHLTSLLCHNHVFFL
ncbi:hypothetical protein E2C01_022709 [Portunus trituberculatus]|uniref:Uncharacterized protein n=1 Tax=Portunus trituberculatus TaxID=210409 RepID=A0A5B7E809_PORTR|nr:hypothetical protein [Portunus trituberculatus]